MGGRSGDVSSCVGGYSYSYTNTPISCHNQNFEMTMETHREPVLTLQDWGVMTEFTNLIDQSAAAFWAC